MFGHRTKTTLMFWLDVAILAAGATSFPALWSLDTELVQQGEWWRLISGHLVHLSWQHYSYDLLALGLVLFLCGSMAKGLGEIIWAALGCGVVVSMSMQVLHPVDVYGGLSGITAGLLAWSALMLIRQGSQVVGGVLMAGMVIKLCLEWRGVSVSGVEAVWQAHCAGALAGALGHCWTPIPSSGLRPPSPMGRRNCSARFIRMFREMRSTP